jgi:hypothetical protein
MRKTYSYSKRETLETCPRRYFYEYYAAAKKVPFNARRKEEVSRSKELSGCYLLAGELLHWAIGLYLKKPEPSFRRWLEAKAFERFDASVKQSQSKSGSLGPATGPGRGAPLTFLEFRNGDPAAAETAAKARDRLAAALGRFFTDEAIVSVWNPLLGGENWVERRIGQLPKVDGWGIEGVIDFASRDDQGLHILDWKLGESAGTQESLQLHIYGLWAERHLGLGAGQVRARRVFLGSGLVEAPAVLEAPAIRLGRARLIQDIEVMRELDPYGLNGEEEAFTPCGKDRVCQQCKYLTTCPCGSSPFAPRPTSASWPAVPTPA